MAQLARSSATVRALVCDDSPLMRRFITDALVATGVEVIGSARDGRETLDLCRRLRPDVITLDLEMPVLGGLDVLRQLGADGPGVIVVSAYTEQGSSLAVHALAIGAHEVIRKPQIGTPPAVFVAELGAAVQATSLVRRRQGPAAAPRGILASPPRRDARASPAAHGTSPLAPRRPPASLSKPLVVVACSTGGPRALTTFLPQLPAPCGAGVVVVQHMPAGFTRPLAERLDQASRLRVREASDGDRVEPGVALIAPGGAHLRLKGDRVVLSDEPPIGALRPRADLTIEDAARDWPGKAVLVVLTGMGNDGLRGARALRNAGGVILSEAEETCVVYGMPRSVEEAGLSDLVQPLDRLAASVTGVIR